MYLGISGNELADITAIKAIPFRLSYNIINFNFNLPKGTKTGMIMRLGLSEIIAARNSVSLTFLMIELFPNIMSRINSIKLTREYKTTDYTGEPTRSQYFKKSNAIQTNSNFLQYGTLKKMIYEVHVQVLNNSDLKMLQAYLVQKI